MQASTQESLFSIPIGIVHVSLLLRHARSLKDKRQVVASLTQRLKNQGFSVAETGFVDEPKRANLGFSYVGSSLGQVNRALEEALRLFQGDFEVLDTQKTVLDFSGEMGSEYSEDEALKFGLE